MAPGFGVRGEELGDSPVSCRPGSTARTARTEARRTPPSPAPRGARCRPHRRRRRSRRSTRSAMTARRGHCRPQPAASSRARRHTETATPRCRTNRRRDGRPAGAPRPIARRRRWGSPVDGGGVICAWCRVKSAPSKSSGRPVSSWRTIWMASSMRRPRVAGSTPQLCTSLRSSPPIPTPNTKRPGATRARSASWRATTTGWRSGSRYTARVHRQPVGDQRGRRRRRASRRRLSR